jgi:hypothetical protein
VESELLPPPPKKKKVRKKMYSPEEVTAITELFNVSERNKPPSMKQLFLIFIQFLNTCSLHNNYCNKPLTWDV